MPRRLSNEAILSWRECHASTASPVLAGQCVNQFIRRHAHIPLYSVWTKGFSAEMKTHVPLSCRDLTYIAQVDDLEHWSLEQLVDGIEQAASAAAMKLGRPADYYQIAGCIAGGEAGVDMADVLSENLGLMTNGAQGDFANRRDKYVSGEAAAISRSSSLRV